jgi:hypothetical protein
MWNKPHDGEVGDPGGDVLRPARAVGTEPMSGPVECAEKGARGDDGIGDIQGAGPDAVRDQGADAALVAIALGDDPQAEPAGQRIDFEVGGRALDLVDEAEDMRLGELPEARCDRPIGTFGLGQCREQVLERPILAEVQDLVLTPEIVIEIARGEVSLDGDLAYAGGRKAARPKNTGRRPENLHAAGVGSP